STGGLPADTAQLLYNVHFLSTSNLASPLEMMEEISSVWDCVHQEVVLVIPWVLAFQGDNPMASEFCSHIGMKGKYLCRVCHARADENNRSPGIAGEKELSLQAGRPRTKAETLEQLSKQERRAFEGAPSAVDGLATETGVKDKYLLHFVNKLQTRLNKWREQEKNDTLTIALSPSLADTQPLTIPTKKSERQAEFLDRVRHEMPENLVNPVLQIEGMVRAKRRLTLRALHVVLLGVVKYWWRDACARQDQHGKATLIARLSSVDVSGLGIPPLRGYTLVHYAGSLVGRDFRAILQVAPSILYGLVPLAAYEAWLALCRLAPLIFQYEIEDMPEYEVS
ncbi:hypothetical protein BV20DRAFT_925278, partial [Pilatotrama ljubarskyi]